MKKLLNPFNPYASDSGFTPNCSSNAACNTGCTDENCVPTDDNGTCGCDNLCPCNPCNPYCTDGYCP